MDASLCLFVCVWDAALLCIAIVLVLLLVTCLQNAMQYLWK